MVLCALAYTSEAVAIAAGHSYQLMRVAKHSKLAVGWSLAIALCALATMIVDAL